MGNSLAELRVGVLGIIGDVDELEATAAGDELTFTDDMNLSREGGTLVGRFLLFDQTSANPGALRRVASNDRDATSVTLNRALDNPVNSGDKAIMLNYRDQGMTKAKVDRNINNAIKACKANYLVPSLTSLYSFSAGAPVLDISTFRGGGVVGVDYRDPLTLEWIELPIADWQNQVDQWALELTLGGLSASNAHQKTVRIRGYSKPGLLTNDNDETIIDYEWLVLYAASLCHFELARRRMDPANNERWGQFRQDQSDERIAKVQLPNYGYYVPLLGDGI